MSIDVFLLQHALITLIRVVRHDGFSSQIRHLCSPLKLYVVKSSGRTWSCTSPHEIGCRIKYHNAPGMSIGIRCNQFGKDPKAAACKSSLQGIGVGDTDGNQTPPRGQSSDLYTSIPYEFDFTLQVKTQKTLFGKPQLLQVIWVSKFSSTAWEI